MGTIIYCLCALTSIGCALLLWRSYQRSRNQLLFWSSVCFVCLALSNILLVVDFILTPPEVSFLVYRSTLTFAGMAALLYGLIKETT